jgi:LysR family transcriptional regulator, transcriptional activator for bauABCD operon
LACAAECSDFSATQGELGIGQSTINSQMLKLQIRLGYRLCERGKVGFNLTPKRGEWYRGAAGYQV